MENIIRKNLKVKGMTCESCKKLIENNVSDLDGVKEIKVDYATGKGHVDFDYEKINMAQILGKIKEKGYECNTAEEMPDKQKASSLKWIGFSALILGFVVVLYFLLRFSDKINLPQISPAMGYGLLFLVGLLTGFHCIAMCGGFVVSYTAKNAKEGKKAHTAHLAYGSGKLISYTIIGAAFGLLGAIIAFTPAIRGFAGIIAGIFLVVFGLSMLGVGFLRKIRIPMPKFVSRFSNKHQNSSPFIIGLLNGLMIACGPLQAIYIMAAGTGSWLEGAKILFVFALGTLPVMIGFGYFASFVSSKATQKILKLSGIVVIILGIVMVNRGLALTGSGYDAKSIITSFSGASSTNSGSGSNAPTTNIANAGYQEIHMDVLSSGWSPNQFVLKKGVPVKWIINGKEITSCNHRIVVPKLGLEFDVKPGEQVIEFTPKDEGVIPFSCWMGMIQGQFIVKADVDLNDKASVENVKKNVAAPSSGGSCSMNGGGGCGCGMGR